MSNILHRDPRTLVPSFVEWFEEPFLTMRPYLGHAIKVEDYTEEGRYVVRAEIAGIDPEKELEVWAGSGYLTIRAAAGTGSSPTPSSVTSWSPPLTRPATRWTWRWTWTPGCRPPAPPWRPG